MVTIGVSPYCGNGFDITVPYGYHATDGCNLHTNIGKPLLLFQNGFPSAQSELSELEPPVVIRSFAVIPQANGPGCLRISGVESRLQFGKACIFSILERIFLASFRAKCIRDSS
jgi:hypothetical protein